MPKSQNLKRHAQILIAALFLVIFVAVACTGGDDTESETPSPPPVELIGNYETCKGFLDAGTVEDLTGKSGLFERERVIPIASIQGLAESGATNNCLIEVFGSFEGNDELTPGDSLALSIVKFQSNESALNLFDSTLASALLSVEQIGDRADVQQEVIGADSYLLNIRAAGIGAIIVYVSGNSFVSMSATSDSHGNALLTESQLIAVAEGVQSRLPEFARDRFTGQ